MTLALLLASIVLLFGAPLLARAFLTRPALASLLDGFVVVSIAGVVAVHVLPESAERAGAAALAVFLCGLVLPVLLHRLERARTAPRARAGINVAVLALGMFAHALLDGAALRFGDPALALAVLLHRIPAGLAFWLVMRPASGTRATLGVMGIYAAGTVVGALFDPVGMGTIGAQGAAGLALFQAFVAGSILHVVIEAPTHGDARPLSRALGVVGACGGVAVLWAIAGGDAHTHAHAEGMGAGAAALAIASALAPAYVAGLVGVGLLEAWVPRRAAGVVGAPAHVVPALLVTFASFGAMVLLVRLVAMTSLAVLGRAAVGPLLVDDAPDTRSRAARFLGAVRGAVDHTGPWMLVGVLAAALLEPSLPRGALAVAPGLPTLVAVAACAGLAFPLYLCAAGLTPIAALLVHKGLPLPAALALLLVGPSISVAALAHVRRAHGGAAAVRVFGAVLGATAVACGAIAFLGVEPPALSALHARAPLLTSLAVAALAGTLILSLYRQGVRAFAEQVLTPAHALESAHVHGPGCAHEHGRPLAPLTRSGHKDGPRVMLTFDPFDPGDPR